MIGTLFEKASRGEWEVLPSKGTSIGCPLESEINKEEWVIKVLCKTSK